MAILETKVLKKKKLDKELNLKISKNEASERIFIEFSSKDGKLIVQKSFQDTYYGRKAADGFENQFQTIDDLKAYFANKH